MREPEPVVRRLPDEANGLELTAAPDRRRAEPDAIGLVSDLDRVASAVDVGPVDAAKQRARHRELDRLTEERRAVDVLVAEEPSRRATCGPSLVPEALTDHGALES